MDYFKLFFTDEIIQLLIIETNRNVQKILSLQRISRDGRFSSLEPIKIVFMSKDVMEKYISFFIMTGGLVKM